MLASYIFPELIKYGVEKNGRASGPLYGPYFLSFWKAVKCLFRQISDATLAFSCIVDQPVLVQRP